MTFFSFQRSILYSRSKKKKKYPLLNKKGTVHVGLMRNYLQSPVTNIYSEMLDRR